MQKDVHEISKDTQELCREGWEIRIRAKLAVEESKALKNQIWKNIRTSRKELKKLKEQLESTQD